MWMKKTSVDNKVGVVIENATLEDIPVIAALFIDSFADSVLHHCGGKLPKPQAMEDVFTLVYQAEPQAALIAKLADGSSIGYCFAPTQLSGLWMRALWGGHLAKWTWRWLTGQYGFGLHPIKIIVMNKVAFLHSAVSPTRSANARILSIAVAPEARGQGVAGQLIEAAMGYFQSQQVTRVRLEVRPGNLPALRVYEKWGFVEDGYTVDSQGKWLIMFKEMEKIHV
jgi:ribosomal protein S18 acetylase RimI-like enzyme